MHFKCASNVADSGVSMVCLKCSQSCVVTVTTIGCLYVPDPRHRHMFAMNAGIDACLSLFVCVSCIGPSLTTQALPMCCRQPAVSGEQGKGVGSSLRANKMLLTGADSTQPGSKGESLKSAVTGKPQSHCLCMLNLVMLVCLMQAYPRQPP